MKRERDMAQFKTTKDFAGEYVVTMKGSERKVDISYHDSFKGWIASARWDNRLYTDVLWTKRDAVHNAHLMLQNS